MKMILETAKPYDYFVFIDEPDIDYHYIAPETFETKKLFLSNCKGSVIEIQLTDEDRVAIGDDAEDILAQYIE